MKTGKLILICAIMGLLLIYLGLRLSEPERLEVSSLTKERLGSMVLLSGRVMDLNEHPDGHLFLKVGEENCTVSVPLFAGVRKRMEMGIELLDWVEVRGRVKEWKGELEVVPSRPEDIRIKREAPRRVGEIGRGEVGKLVKVWGRVKEVTKVGENFLLLTLEEDGKELDVFLPFSIGVRVGERIVAAGRVQLYREKLEVVVKRNTHLYFC
ncbi:MAG: hypothetical protein DSO02_04840 [Hadesarchaea archaeon]|nr:MAG: hypothetical protein DSO03_02060 [Hadesarchaea archaeon]TDA32885.1 MAG: hypothetical protein DSO02_04840 [Hadesarchaea archaeon]